MTGRGALMRDANRLAWWLRAAAWIASAGGALLLVAALRIAWTQAGPYGIGTFKGTVWATVAVTALCLAFLLRRHAQNVTAATATGQLGPLADAAAYETGYWRVVTPLIVLGTAIAVRWFLSRVAGAGTTFREASWARAAADEAMTLETLVLHLVSVLFLGVAILIVTQAVTRRSQFAGDVWRSRAAGLRGWLEVQGQAMREAQARRLEARAPVAVPQSAPPEPFTDDLPAALIEQWSKTGPLVTSLGCIGTLGSLVLAVGAVVAALLFFPVAPLFFVASIFFFVAMMALAACRLLSRHGQAIDAAETKRSISAAEDVLHRQTRYWKLTSIGAAIILVLVLAAFVLGGLAA